MIVFLILYIPIIAGAKSPDYPRDYFRNPLDIPIILAGNFGECRPGHFHSGIDIKTAGVENKPVYAAAEGYVSRIKMEPGGFGHGLYITHPNGYTTLYAHLNDFAPRLQKYVRAQQYAKESWTVDLQFPPDLFPVRKGEQIAWSGNTGGSTAPHLHFEIRDSKTEHPLNPQLFGFEITDEVPPRPLQLAVYDMAKGIYNSSPRLLPLSKRGDVYSPSQDSISIATSLAGLGVVVNDFMNGSTNTLAFYTVEWFQDDSLLGRIRLDDIGYDETRYLHAYADYRTKENGGPWVQGLFRLKGNRLQQIYESMNPAAGMLLKKDDDFHHIRIELTDVYGNRSSVHFYLQQKPPADTPCQQSFYSDRMNPIEQPTISFVLDEMALYEDVCMTVSAQPDPEGFSNRFTVGRADVPVHHYFDLQLKPNKLVPFALRNKLAIIYRNGTEVRGTAAAPVAQGWYKASVRALGEYRLAVDTSAPGIKPVTAVKGNLSKARKIAFRATDDLTSVKSFRGELDGKWILFEQHGSIWTYEFDEHCPKGLHKLVIRASDENGNKGTASFSFTR